MKKPWLIWFTLLSLLFSNLAFAAPSQLILTNQFGEVGVNTITGPTLPLAGSANVVLMTGATTPVNGGSGTGHGIAAKGSIYIAQDTGQAYTNTNTKASPTWTASSGTGITAVLTGYTAGAGVIAATDTILEAFQKAGGNEADLKNGKFTPSVQALSGAGAVNTTSMETTVTNAGSTYAVTLAAPSSQDGQIKIIKAITAMAGTVTLACTNIAFSGAYTPTGTTTLTFTNVGDSAIFMAVGSKWVYLGGSAVAS